MRAVRKRRWPGFWFATDLRREDAWMPRTPISAELRAQVIAVRLKHDVLRAKQADTAKPWRLFSPSEK